MINIHPRGLSSVAQDHRYLWSRITEDNPMGKNSMVKINIDPKCLVTLDVANYVAENLCSPFEPR
jgi:hypothetical protein